EDDLLPFYEKKYKYLIDFNLGIQNVILENLDINVDVKLTKEFVYTPDNEWDDFRNLITPKTNISNSLKIVEYTQVFKEKHGFIPNLSIIDLLFNEGPNAPEILKIL
nr:WbqC family protein [Bacteroidales bacterium]